MCAGGLGRLPGEETGVGETRSGDKGKRFLGARRGLPAPGLAFAPSGVARGVPATCACLFPIGLPPSPPSSQFPRKRV